MSNLEELSEKIRKIEEESTAHSSKKQRAAQEKEDKRTGMQAGAELISSFAGGALIGYFLDHWLGTSPVFLLFFMLLGMIVGFYNIYRLTNNLGAAVGYAQLHRELHQKQKNAKTSQDKKTNNLENKAD